MDFQNQSLRLIVRKLIFLNFFFTSISHAKSQIDDAV